MTLDTNNTSDGFTSNGKRHLDLFNKDLTPYNVWDDTTHTFHGLPAGHPGYSNFIDARMCTDNKPTKEPMSQDEAIGVLQGLALIKKYCPTYEEERSKNIACNIITYIRNKLNFNNPPDLWLIYKPDGTAVKGDDDATWFGGPGDASRYVWGFVQASKFFYGPCINDYNNPESYIVAAIMMNTYFSDEMLWQSEGLFTNPQHDYNDDMEATLAAIGKSWHTGITITIGWCPFCFHIPVYIPATGWGINNTQHRYNNETFYLLLYEALQKKHTSYLLHSKATTQLNTAPCEGPYDYGIGYRPDVDMYGGWASSYRWRNTFDEQRGAGGFGGNYNGLDYMLFYNLNHLIYGGIPYEDYISRYLSGTVNSPIKYAAFDSIYST